MSRRIAIISEHASPVTHLGGVDSGGQNVYVGQTARSLAALGYQVDVFTRRDNPALPEVMDWVDGIRIINVPAGPAQFVPKEKLLPYMEDFSRHLLRYCRRYAYQLLHANFWMSGLVAADVKKATGVPFVVTFHALGRVRRLHQGENDGFPDERFAIEERIVAEADAIVAECPQEKADLIEHYQADPRCISLVPAGFDPAEFEPVNKVLARITTGLHLNERLILQLGRMVPRKGVDNVIRALARLQDTHGVPARLVVVGGEGNEADPLATPEIGRLLKIAEAEGVAGQVSFVGRRGREMLKHYYSAADVFVTTPWYEPFGITPLEAMACATPVIGANVGGIKTTVQDGETGFLVPPKDPEALAERLARLFQNPALIELFGLRGLQQVKDHYSWEKVTGSLASLYESVVVRGKPQQAPALGGSVRLLQGRKTLAESIQETADALARCFIRGSNVLVCGNGASALDFKQDFDDFSGRFQRRGRRGLPILTLSHQPLINAASAAQDYAGLLAGQVAALGQPGDLLLAIATGGEAGGGEALVEAMALARERELNCLVLQDQRAGELFKHADIAIVLPASDPQGAQSLQTLVQQMLSSLIRDQLEAAGAIGKREQLFQAANNFPLGGEEPLLHASCAGRHKEVAKKQKG